jgi:hypothetical protein
MAYERYFLILNPDSRLRCYVNSKKILFWPPLNKIKAKKQVVPQARPIVVLVRIFAIQENKFVDKKNLRRENEDNCLFTVTNAPIKGSE